MRFRPAVVLLFALCRVSFTAHAQAALATLHVRVTDSTDAPIPMADVTVVSGLSTVVASGRTNARGEVALSAPIGVTLQVVARHVGFVHGTRFLTSTAQPMAVTLKLSSVVSTLAAVTVTAQEDVKRRAYHVDADEIAASKRNIADGLDVLMKLRPDIVDARSEVPCHPRNVFVNGKRIIFADANERLSLDKRHKQATFDATIPIQGGGHGIPPYGIASMPVNVLSVLSSIKPEHIEEINFADCLDVSVPGTNTSAAIFIALKPGVAFEPGRGSYLLLAPVALAPNRARLVGVYDAQSGLPLADVEVADSASGSFVKTTETGTAALAFLTDGVHTIHLRKNGFVGLTLPIAISERDSLPLTLTLAPRY